MGRAGNHLGHPALHFRSVEPMKEIIPKYSGQANRVWPEGESACIWMQAGLVAFKLCDRAFACAGCPFDELMRSGAARSAGEGSSAGEGDRQRVTGLGPESQESPLPSLHFDPATWYGAGFWYMRPRGSRLFEIGLNENGTIFLPPVREVILPRRGASLTTSQPTMWLITSDGTLGLTAPCDGVVRSVNPGVLEELSQKAELPIQSFFMEIRVTSSRRAVKGRLRGDKAAACLRAQYLEILQCLTGGLGDESPEKESLHGKAPLTPGALSGLLGSKRYFNTVAPFYAL